MVFLVLAVACSVGIAALFNLAERRQLDRTALLTVNYAAAALLAVGLQGATPMSGVTLPLVALGVGQGVLFIVGFWLFSVAIRQAGMGLAAGVMRLSVLIPVLASWGIWGETPSGLQLVGLVLGGVAFFLVARPAPPVSTPVPAPVKPADGEPADEEPAGGAAAGGAAAGPGIGVALLLGLLFLSGGAVDVLNKAFSKGFSETVPKPTFLLFVFGVAFVVGLAMVVVQGLRTQRWPRGAVLGWGVVVGLVNYGSADFFLRAVDVLPAPFVFPANSVSIVLGAALVGFVVWGERISRINAAGLVLALVALVLLAR